jgi:primosomal protein N' (replication factor Y)
MPQDQPVYVEVSVNVPQVSGTFHYHLPPELIDVIQPGHLVEVPFGRQQVQGVIFRFVERPEVSQTRPVTALLDAQTALTPLQIELAKEMAEWTLAPLSSCISLMLPPGLVQQADTLYSRSIRSGESSLEPLTPLQKRLLRALEERGPLRGRQLDAAFRRADWRVSMRGLVRRGMVGTESVLPPSTVKPKQVRTATLACPAEEAAAQRDILTRRGSAAGGRRLAILDVLLHQPGPVEAAWLYAESGGNLSDLKVLEKLGLVRLGEAETWRDPLAELEFVPVEPPPLMVDQQAAWLVIQEGLQQAAEGQFVRPYLLHGVTGSGKTEIYMQAVTETLRLGRQAVVLVPEIALTPQTVRRFLSRFPGQVGVVHSRLSAGERYDTWRRARLGQLPVIIGPRSALFAPLDRLGLVVVDEFHDDTYYQTDVPPSYHAREAAVRYARLAGAVCLLGSATPDVASQYRAEQGEYQLLRLPQRILAHRQAVRLQVERLRLTSRYRPVGEQAETIELPPVEVVDMRLELQAGNRSIFSRSLNTALSETLEHGQQAILFLNRRGSATYVFCRDCGYTLKCPRCEVPLTLHTDTHEGSSRLTCHYCGYQRQLPRNCPQCKGERIRQYGTGTERVESEVHQLFPDVRTLRWDYETTRTKGAHEAILSHFASHHADVLVGTQMIAKGLDLPLVTLVGVVLADVGLSLPDVRASERTFQVLTQVAGRAGRSPLGGQVILQTFMPEHYVIKAAAGHDYTAFYQQELVYRRQLGYPPFAHLVRLEYRHRQADAAQAAAQALSGQIAAWQSAPGISPVQVIGPAPCFFDRLNGMYRWQIVLRGADPAHMLRGRSLADWRIEVDPPSLL